MPYPEAAFYSEHSKTLSALLAVSFKRLEIEGEAKQIDAHFVTPNFFHELGARAELGRVLDPSQDESLGSAPVVVLNHWFWQSHFGADPSVIEKTIRLNGQPATVIMKDSFRNKVESAEYGALAVSLLGAVALLLACLGIVGLVAYAVSQRTKEIGIRIAIGARPSHILLTILRQFSRPVIGGLLAGVGGAAALSHLLRGELYGVSNLDPVAYAAAVSVFVAMAALAAALPARRALSVDPIGALRYD